MSPARPRSLRSLILFALLTSFALPPQGALQRSPGGARPGPREPRLAAKVLPSDRPLPAPPEPESDPFSVADEKYQYRAWPAAEVDPGLRRNSPAAFAGIVEFQDDDEKIPFDWKSVGPNTALYPAVLGRANAPYISSGRITALAIDPNCDERRCRLYVGAAGGGIWRTKRALSDAETLDWRFISGSFTSNAIGSILIDPTDPSGDTIYAGTGEPNASADSEAGTGIFKSTDGGDTWAPLAANATIGGIPFTNFPRDRAIGSMAIDPRSGAFYVALARAVRGVEDTSTGATSNPPPTILTAPFGLYKSSDGGSNFTRIWDGNASLRGVTKVELDPRDLSTVYASAFQQGLWRSEAGGPFQQVFAPQNPINNADRTQFALALKNGHTRIYLGNGADQSSLSPVRASVWRADTADAVPAAALLASQSLSIPLPGLWKKLTTNAVGSDGYATFDYCTGQCWYDNDILTPPGMPDTVYVLGSFYYNESFTYTNARAVLRSTTAGDPDGAHGNRTFTDLTFDATSATAPNSIHPDQHALAFVPGKPDIWFEGSDGGLMRSSGRYLDASSQCDSRVNFDGTPLNPAQLKTCRQLLSAIPTRLTSLNNGLNTIQFQTLSLHPKLPQHIAMGGTQDNGTFSFTGSKRLWKQTGGGDGGFSGFNVARPDFRFRTNFGQHVHGTRSGDEPTKWYHIGGPFLFSPEGSLFYMPIIYDPHPAAADTIFAGNAGVWRSQDNGGDPDFLEANCNSLQQTEKPTCGDFVELGGTPGRLTDASRGLTRTGGAVNAMARAVADTSTLWVSTSAGRVFVSQNADGPAASVTYSRIDALSPLSPPRYPSAIVVDSQNRLHAWITYGGYSGTVVGGSDPNRPGHVFEVNVDVDPVTHNIVAAVYVPLDDGLGPMGDLPVTALARDDSTGDLYVGTDFGVLRQPAGTTHWHVAGRGLPVVEITHLTRAQDARLLYASTHGRGAYRLHLKGAAGDDDDDARD